MGSRWGKAGKVGIIMLTIVASLTAIAYALFFRLTDLEETLAKEKEINQKALKYGMYRTQQDVEQARSVPESENAAPTITKACKEFQLGERAYSKTEKSYNQIWNMERFVRSGSFKLVLTKENRQTVQFYKPYLDDFFKTCEPVLDRPSCIFQRDWSRPFEMGMPEYRQINQVRRLNLFEGYLAAAKGDQAGFVRSVRRDARLRMCMSHMDEWLWPYLACRSGKKEAAAFFGERLTHVKSPSKDLLISLRQNLDVKINEDFRHLCRTYFYLGAGGFPDESRWKGIVQGYGNSSDAPFVARIPRLKKAWQLRIQWGAIQAFEAGLANEGKPDGPIVANDAFDRAANNAGTSSWFISSALPGGTPHISTNAYDKAPGLLDAKLKALGY